jgi:hypothetical protein
MPQLHSELIQPWGCLMIKKIFLLIFILAATNLMAVIEEQTTEESDILSNRNPFTPRAKTLKKGEIVINSYELLFESCSFGLTDALQFDIGTSTIPLFSSAVSMKYAFIDEKFMTLAVQPTLIYFFVLESFIGTYSGGIICDIHPTSQFTLSSGIHGGPNWSHYYDYDKDKEIFVPYTKSFTFIADIGTEYKLDMKFQRSTLKFISEITIIGDGNSFNTVSGMGGVACFYGLRVSNNKAGIDFCLIKGLNKTESDIPWYFALGFPYISLGYKF